MSLTDDRIDALIAKHCDPIATYRGLHNFARACIAEATATQWPKSKIVGRIGDMAPREKTHMRLILQEDGDVIVNVWDDERGDCLNASIEFCTLTGGGKSMHTRKALVAVMVAMEADNAETPWGQFPPAQPLPAAPLLPRGEPNT